MSDDKTQSKTEADLLVERFAAAMDERIKPLSEKVEAVSSWQKRIEEEATKPPARDPADITPEEKDRNEKETLLKLAVATNARLTEQECLNSLRGQWDHLIPEVQEWFKKTNLQTKAQPDYPDFCSRVVDMVIGKAVKNNLRYNSNAKRFFIEDGAGAKGGEPNPLHDGSMDWVNPNDPNGRVVSADETLRKLGLDPNDKAVQESIKRGLM